MASATEKQQLKGITKEAEGNVPLVSTPPYSRWKPEGLIRKLIYSSGAGFQIASRTTSSTILLM